MLVALDAGGAVSLPLPSGAVARAVRVALAVLVGVMAGATVRAGEVVVTVRAPNGAPVADAALVLEAVVPAAPARARQRPTAHMEQRQRRFIPEVLVVETGTLVAFPNNDTLSHQVYSFSPARRFQLSLYKGTVHPPIEFDTAGLVVLGCNIHDDMVGYILVTESPFHGQTDKDGTARITGVPPGAYRVRLWAPRIADPAPILARPVEVGELAAAEVDFRLTRPLLAAPTPRPGRAAWDVY
jgi:plastocyanin